MSPANAISLEVDNEPLINDKNASENKDPSSNTSEKDVVVIYGSSPPPPSSHSSLDENPTLLSSKSPNHQRLPSIKTFTVGDDGIFPSKLICHGSSIPLILVLSKSFVALFLDYLKDGIMPCGESLTQKSRITYAS